MRLNILLIFVIVFCSFQNVECGIDPFNLSGAAHDLGGELDKSLDKLDVVLTKATKNLDETSIKFNVELHQNMTEVTENWNDDFRVTTSKFVDDLNESGKALVNIGIRNQISRFAIWTGILLLLFYILVLFLITYAFSLFKNFTLLDTIRKKRIRGFLTAMISIGAVITLAFLYPLHYQHKERVTTYLKEFNRAKENLNIKKMIVRAGALEWLEEKNPICAMAIIKSEEINNLFKNPLVAFDFSAIKTFRDDKQYWEKKRGSTDKDLEFIECYYSLLLDDSKLNRLLAATRCYKHLRKIEDYEYLDFLGFDIVKNYLADPLPEIVVANLKQKNIDVADLNSRKSKMLINEINEFHKDKEDILGLTNIDIKIHTKFFELSKINDIIRKLHKTITHGYTKSIILNETTDVEKLRISIESEWDSAYKALKDIDANIIVTNKLLFLNDVLLQRIFLKNQFLKTPSKDFIGLNISELLRTKTVKYKIDHHHGMGEGNGGQGNLMLLSTHLLRFMFHDLYNTRQEPIYPEYYNSPYLSQYRTSKISQIYGKIINQNTSSSKLKKSNVMSLVNNNYLTFEKEILIFENLVKTNLESLKVDRSKININDLSNLLLITSKIGLTYKGEMLIDYLINENDDAKSILSEWLQGNMEKDKYFILNSFKSNISAI